MGDKTAWLNIRISGQENAFTIRCTIDGRKLNVDIPKLCHEPYETWRAIVNASIGVKFSSKVAIKEFLANHIKGKELLQPIDVQKISDYIKYTNLDCIKIISKKEQYYKLKNSSFWRKGEIKDVLAYTLKKPLYMIYDINDITKLIHPSDVSDTNHNLYRVKLNYMNYLNDTDDCPIEIVHSIPQSQYILNISIAQMHPSGANECIGFEEPTYMIFDFKNEPLSPSNIVFPEKYFRESIKHTIQFDLIDISIIDDIMNIIFTPVAKQAFKVFCYKHFVSFEGANCLNDIMNWDTSHQLPFNEGIATHYIKELTIWLGCKIPYRFAYSNDTQLDEPGYSIINIIDSSYNNTIYNKYISESFNAWKDNNKYYLYEQMGVMNSKFVHYAPEFYYWDLIDSAFAIHFLKWIGK
jgi:hypothetical protein